MHQPQVLADSAFFLTVAAWDSSFFIEGHAPVFPDFVGELAFGAVVFVLSVVPAAFVVGWGVAWF